MKNHNILDCTLRDGGYYNNWDFPSNIVNEYLFAMSKAGIKYVELGFRSMPISVFKGPNYYTSDFYLNSLDIPKSLKIAVMVNASQLAEYENNIKAGVKILFDKKSKSRVDLIRIAAHFNEIDLAIKIIRECNSLGYSTALNLMQISEQSESQIRYVLKKINRTDIKILYFADSLGCMSEKDTKKIVSIIKNNWQGPIGAHMHDNMEKALSNSEVALNTGVNWVDCTVTGMGRGAGNVKTEHLILALNNKKNLNFGLNKLLELKHSYFDELKRKYNWGANPNYYLAAKSRIHPTYIQEMISMKFPNIEIVEAINQLKQSGGSKYSADLVKSDFQNQIILEEGNFSPSNTIKKREVLLIASGSELKKNNYAIINYIKNKKPIVIAVNTEVEIKDKFIDYYIACNPLKVIAYFNDYKKIKKPIILPRNVIQKSILKKLNNKKIYNFGVGLNLDQFVFKNRGAVIPRLYNLAYALAIATSGNAKKILLAGFDGYGLNDVRTKIINDLIYQYSLNKKSKQIFAITPTSYSLKFDPIYNFK